MDANLRSETIDLITKLSNNKLPKIINNKSQHYEGHTIRIIPYTGACQRKDIVDGLIQQLEEGLKVSVHCTSKKLTKIIYDEAQKRGFKATMYHGDSYDKQTIEQFGIDMKKTKEEDFKDINKALQHTQLLCYTGTMTAGIDIQKRFDTFTHIFTGKDQTPDSFVQGCFRVRHYAGKSHTMYVSGNRQASFIDTPTGVEKRINDLIDPVTRLKKQTKQNYQLMYICIARLNNIRVNGVEIIKGTLEGMGFKITDCNAITRVGEDLKMYKESLLKLSVAPDIQYEKITPDFEIFAKLNDKQQDKSKLIDEIPTYANAFVDSYKLEHPDSDEVAIADYYKSIYMKREAYIAEQYHLWQILIQGFCHRGQDLIQYANATENDRITILRNIKGIRNIRLFFADKTLGCGDLFDITPLQLLTLDRVHEQYKTAIGKSGLEKNKHAERIDTIDLNLYR